MSGEKKRATTVRLDEDCSEALEQFRREQDTIPSVPKAIEMILRDWFMVNSYLTVEEEPDDGAQELPS